MVNNLILKTDSYKTTHWKQYPTDTIKIYSYLESRGGKTPATMFFGLQYILKKHLTGVVVTLKDIDYAEEFLDKHFGIKLFNREGWTKLVERYGGKLPIKIKAVPEGTVVPVGNVLMTIENTDPEFFWLTNYLETLLMQVWYPITVSTNGYYAKKIIKSFLEETEGNSSSISFKLHDFGYRGVSCDEQAGIGAAAHLINFMGTDTLAGIIMARHYYSSEEMLGFSVPASEHSTMTSWGKDKEDDAIINMIKSYPDGVVSVVGDSYNICNFCERISKSPIKEAILNRKGVFVVRPDSGDPIEVNSKVIDLLWNNFGGEYNSKGYKVLDSHIRIIQGDGIDIEMIASILSMLKAKKYSAENIVFGSGGGLLQKFDRDTHKFAIKASYGEKLVSDPSNSLNSIYTESTMGFDIQKDPITSSGKKSKKGILKLHKTGSAFMTISSSDTTSPMFNGYVDHLQTVFENGELKVDQTFAQVREVSNKY